EHFGGGRPGIFLRGMVCRRQGRCFHIQTRIVLLLYFRCNGGASARIVQWRMSFEVRLDISNRQNISPKNRVAVMEIKLELAKTTDALAIADLRMATAQRLTERFGEGPRSGKCTERGTLFAMQNASVHILRERGCVVATLT